MKILVAGTSYYPQFTAGTELYMSLLCRHLRELGDETTIACGGLPTIGTGSEKWNVERFQHEGQPVIRIARREGREQASDSLCRWDKERAQVWEQVLNETRPDLVFTVGAAPVLLGDVEAIASRQSIPSICTLIHPGQVCPKGPRIDADGKGCMRPLSASTCTDCLLRGRGAPSWLTRILRPSPLTDPLARLQIQGSLGTALGLPGLVAGFIQHWIELIRNVDLFVAHSEAARELLLSNGIPNRRILFSPPGYWNPPPSAAPTDERHTRADSPLRFGFVGRICEEKGIPTLVDAWQLLPEDSHCTLDIWGKLDQAEELPLRELRRLSETDTRVRIRGPFAPEDAPQVYRDMDALIVPSEWFDNCPFVISEAFTAGIPVVGTDFGGISTMVEEGRNGHLFPFGDASALADILAGLAACPANVDRLAAGVTAPRMFGAHAEELRAAMERLVSDQHKNRPGGESAL